MPYDSSAKCPICTGGRGESFGEDSGGIHQFRVEKSWTNRESFNKNKII